MNEARSAFRARIYRLFCCFILFYAASAASFNGYYTVWHFHEAGVSGIWPQVGIDQILDGTASRPVMYRNLIPSIANGIDRVTPQRIKDRIINQRLGHEQAPGVSPLRLSRTYMIRYELVYQIDFLFVLLSVYAMHLVCKSYGCSLLVSIFAPVIFILLFPYFLNWGGYYYDYSELAFFALSIWASRKYDWWWLLPLAFFGTWNKETYLLFIPMLYPFIRARASSRLRALAGTGLLCMVSAAVFFVIRTIYVNNPGGTGSPGEFTRGHLDMLLHLYRLIVRVDGVYGVYTLSSFSLFPFAMIAWTIYRAWSSFTPEFKLHAKLAALINFPLFFFFCSLYETRNLSLMYMVFFMGLAINLQESFAGSKLQNALQPQRPE